MSASPRSPVTRWFPLALIAAALVAVLCGWAFYDAQVRARSVAALSDSAREELASLVVPAVKTAEVERGWIPVAPKEAQYLIAPVGPMPCEPVTNLVAPADQPVVRNAWLATQDADGDARVERLAEINDASNNLLVVQMHGTALTEAGLYADAERVLAQGLGATNEDEEIIRAARTNASLDLDDLKVSTVIHVHHALGVARLKKSLDEPPWVSLKNVIGSVKPLSRRRLGAPSDDVPVASRLLIAAPGCTRGAGQRSLSSYDLFNNLIVAYMNGNFVGGESEREREFARPPRDRPAPVQKLLLALVAHARSSNWENESKLWALSNVEQVIDWRIPDDARIAFNSVQVIDWWTNHCPAEICTSELLAEIEPVRNALIGQAFQRRNVIEDQRTTFAHGMTRLLASSSIKRSEVAPSAAKVGEWLTAADRRTLADLIAADTARADLPRFLFAKAEAEDSEQSASEVQQPPEAKLGSRAEQWRAAAMTDVATVASSWAAGRSAQEQRAAIVAIRQLLGTSEAPPELIALERKQTWTQRFVMRLTAAKWLWAFLGIVIAVLIWLILVWVLVHAREWMLLRVSFYNVELRNLAKIDRTAERR